MTPEGKVKERVKRLLKEHGIWYFMPIGSGMGGRAGIPDFCCVCKGQPLFVETKAGRGKPTPLQNLCMEEIRQAGGIAVVVNEKNIENFHALLHSIGATENDKS